MVKKSKPSISIITPNYNYASYIHETIESVLSQDYLNFEHIIIDDGSTDNSVEIIKRYQSEYPNQIRLFQQENKGQTSAINLGMQNARGDYIGWINSDDTYCNGIFSQVINRFLENPEYDVIYGDVNIVDVNGFFMYRKRHTGFCYQEGVFVGFGNVITSNAIFWKKELNIKKGLLNEELKCNMDGEFFSRLTSGVKVQHIPVAFANFRKQPHTKASEKDKKWANLVEAERDFEMQKTYSKLFISKILPYKYSSYIRLIFRFKRFIKRMGLLYLFRQHQEYAYYKKSQMNDA
jgi:glycosyltransferase involved in cell wall biosynthesis